MTESIVAAVQMNSCDDLETNLSVAAGLLESARDAGALVAALPENFAFMGANERAKLSISEPLAHGPIQQFLADTAKRLGLWIVAGSVPIKVEDDPEKVWPACLVFNDQGRCAAHYNKIHLFDVAIDRDGQQERYEESRHFAQDDWRPTLVDTPAGNLGLSICYDLRFPELYRELSQRGAELLCVPAAFTDKTGAAHWESLLRARAIENQCYVVAPAQFGKHPDGRRTWGHSMIIDPWGTVLACKEEAESAVIATVDLDAQARIRESFPALKHRRG